MKGDSEFMTIELPGVAAPEGIGLFVKVDGARTPAELTALINSVCDQAEEQPDGTAVILDLGEAPAEHGQWPGDVTIQTVNRWERAVRRVESLDGITVAVAQGTCGGPALDLLLAVDFRMGVPGLQLQLPVNDGHIWPGMLLYRLVRHLGLAAARRIVMRGADLSLGQAVDLGLIDQVADDVQGAVHAATALTGRMADRETAVRRQLLLEAASVEYDDALGAHLAACERELRRLRNERPTASVPTGRSRA
jgi:isomerase DpgB